MQVFRTVVMVVKGLLTPFLWACLVFAQKDLTYQPRGNRYEGVVQPKTSGNDLELLSALVNYTEPASSLPDVLSIRFFLKTTTEAYITVRGVRVAQDYWMNKVHPQHPWGAGFNNQFGWNSGEVLQSLGTVRSMYDLGVVVRLGKDLGITDFVEERVAPALFYHHQLPNSIQGYRFTFRPITYESLECKVYRDTDDQSNSRPLSSQVYAVLEPGVPFNVDWSCGSAEDGWYKLVVRGQKQYSREPVDKIVHFYHAKASQGYRE